MDDIPTPEQVELNELLEDLELLKLAKARMNDGQKPISVTLDELDLEPEEKREAYKQDALNAWTEHLETGLRVNAAEISAWLETWGSDHEQPPPKCHK